MARPKTFIPTEDRARVLTCLDYEHYLSIGDIAERTGLKPYRARRAVRDVMWDGLVEKIGKTKGTKYRLIKPDKPSIVKLEAPGYIKAYFSLPVHYITTHEFSNISGTPVGTAYRYIKRWERIGLVERDPHPVLINGKRTFRVRRIYRAITLNYDGSAILHHELQK